MKKQRKEKARKEAHVTKLIDKFLRLDDAHKVILGMIEEEQAKYLQEAEKHQSLDCPRKAEASLESGSQALMKAERYLTAVLARRAEAKTKSFQVIFDLQDPSYLQNLYAGNKVTSTFVAGYQKFVQKVVRKEANVQVAVKKAADLFKAGLVAKRARLLPKVESLVAKIEGLQHSMATLAQLADTDAIAATFEMRKIRNKTFAELAQPAYRSLVATLRQAGRVDQKFIEKYGQEVAKLKKERAAAASEAKGTTSE